MTSIETLTDFLQSTDASFRFFDMGRRFSKIDTATFHGFERMEIPYPFPLMRQAWFAVLIWNPKQQNQQQIWFLKFPLDEQGKLIFAARDDLLRRLATSVGAQLLDRPVEDDAENDPLKDNPFSFTPDQQRMAAFHAQATKLLKQQPSTFYPAVQHYLLADTDKTHWDRLGLQGIADLCARLDEDDQAKRLAKALPLLPKEPLGAFCQQLENIKIPYPVTEALHQLLNNALIEQPDPALLSLLLRALSQSDNTALQTELIKKVLHCPASQDIELLASIGSRYWSLLTEPDIALLYLQQLAENNAGQASFSLMLQDLLYLPGMRDPLLGAIRNPARTEALSKAVGEFFK